MTRSVSDPVIILTLNSGTEKSFSPQKNWLTNQSKNVSRNRLRMSRQVEFRDVINLLAPLCVTSAGMRKNSRKSHKCAYSGPSGSCGPTPMHLSHSNAPLNAKLHSYFWTSATRLSAPKSTTKLEESGKPE